MSVRAALAAGESAAGAAGPASFSKPGGDFYTANEMAQFVKPRKKRLKKKLRKKDADEEEPVLDIAALESASASAPEAAGDHGSRTARGAGPTDQQAMQRLADLQRRQERCGWP